MHAVDLEELVTALPWIAFVAAGSIVRYTIVPERFRGVVAIVILFGLGGAGVAIARAAGLELQGGRCRAKTTDGSRCQLSRDPGADLCHVHQRTHDVEIHPSAIESEGIAGELDVNETAEQ